MVNVPTSGLGPRNDLRQLSREVATLRAELDRLKSSARQFEAMTIGRGGITVQQPGDITIVDASQNTVWAASNGPVVFRNAWSDTDGITFTSSWVGWDSSEEVPVPAGYGQVAGFVWGSTGATFEAGGGVIGVQPYAYVYDPAESVYVNAWDAAAISNGTDAAQALSVSGMLTFSSSLARPDLPVKFGAYAYAVGATAGSANLHLSMLLVFTR